MDLHGIPSLFSFGIPEYIIPAVPCHAVAYILSDLLVFPFERNTEKTGQDKSYSSAYPLNEPLVSELFIKPEESEYSELMTFFEDVVNELPKNIIAGTYPEQGILFLSYAQAGEICPDDCPGPRTH